MTHMLLTAIAIAVKCNSRRLPAISTIILALGTQKMAQRTAIIRNASRWNIRVVLKLSVQITGTLTLNQMTVEKWSVTTKSMMRQEEIFKDTSRRVMNLA